MANYDGSLEAVDCHIHSREIRYGALGVDLAAVSDASSGHLLRCSDADTPKECLSRSQRKMRYGAREKSCRPSQMPHQVTYDVVATPIRPTNA
eukprot:scaffold23812_cov91-Skeletonema_marinoi.AAC.1